MKVKTTKIFICSLKRRVVSISLNSNLNVISVVYETTVSASAQLQVSLGKIIDITDGKITSDTFCGAVAYYGGFALRNYLSNNGNLYVLFDSEMTFTNIQMRFIIFGKK